MANETQRVTATSIVVPLAGRIAVVTGASSGIGCAIGIALSREGAQLCAVGRNPVTLAETVTAARRFSQVRDFKIDLTLEENLQPLLGTWRRSVGSTFSFTSLGSFIRI